MLKSRFKKSQFLGLLSLFLLFLFAGNYSVSAAAWKLSRNIWSEADEKAYSDFVEKLGDSKYSNINKFIRDPKANPLYGEEDKKFNLLIDCADLPYLIRAYVAYKLRLPFSYASAISSKGGDQRYGRGNRPTAFKDQDYFSSPQQLFSQVTLINSGYFRTGPEIEDSDFYPVKISRRSIVPGTIYYDPDGHIAMVSKVTEDGRIRVIDGHPDRTISKPWFGAKFTRGSKSNGGGFKRWRPIRYTSEGKIVRTRNHNISDYSADDQYHKTFTFKGQTGLTYHEYVRKVMTEGNAKSDPVKEFALMMHDLHEDINYRAMAVNICIEKKIHLKPHPGALPWNIYGTDGLWEEFSTPSRDARLKVAFREFYDRSRQLIFDIRSQLGESASYDFARRMLNKYDELSPLLSVSYENSDGKRVILSFHDVCSRLFDLSFDPYHSIEYRWGADGAELASSRDDAVKKRFYELEKRLRNQIERVYNKATPLSMGPETPPAVDVRAWLVSYLQGHEVDDKIIAINREIVMPAVIKQPDAIQPKNAEVVVSSGNMQAASKQIDLQTVTDKPALPSEEHFESRLNLQAFLEFGDQLAAAVYSQNNFPSH